MLKASSKTTKAYSDSTFEVEPQRVQIAPFSSTYATVSFNPLTMTSYSSYFEATLENMPPSSKTRSIAFEISGEGNLPRFTIQKPSLRNKKGQSLMLFKRTIINSTDCVKQRHLADQSQLFPIRSRSGVQAEAAGERL